MMFSQANTTAALTAGKQRLSTKEESQGLWMPVKARECYFTRESHACTAQLGRQQGLKTVLEYPIIPLFLLSWTEVSSWNCYSSERAKMCADWALVTARMSVPAQEQSSNSQCVSWRPLHQSHWGPSIQMQTVCPTSPTEWDYRGIEPEL